jgi:hypothetical protein
MQPLPQAVCVTPQLLVRLEIGWLVRASCVEQASDIWNDRKNCLAAEATLVSLIHKNCGPKMVLGKLRFLSPAAQEALAALAAKRRMAQSDWTSADLLPKTTMTQADGASVYIKSDLTYERAISGSVCEPCGVVQVSSGNSRTASVHLFEHFPAVWLVFENEKYRPPFSKTG